MSTTAECREAEAAVLEAEDQVAVICRYTPVRNDTEAADLGRVATVAQLKRTLSRYAFDEPVRAPEPDAVAPEPEPEPEEARRVSFGFDDDGSWRLSAVLPADEAGPDRGPPAPVRRRRRRLEHGVDYPPFIDLDDPIYGASDDDLDAWSA